MKRANMGVWGYRSNRKRRRCKPKRQRGSCRSRKWIWASREAFVADGRSGRVASDSHGRSSRVQIVGHASKGCSRVEIVCDTSIEDRGVETVSEAGRWGREVLVIHNVIQERRH